MPLIHSKSKKSLKKNIETEMDAHPDKRSQDLAIAYSVQRKAKKKMAEGGAVKQNSQDSVPSAKSESRPMPGRIDDTGKPLKDSSWTGRPTVKQAQTMPKPKLQPIHATKMAESGVIKAHRIDSVGRKLDEEETHLEESTAPGAYGEQPSSWHDEQDARRMGSDPDMPKPHTTRKAYANGGEVDADHEGDSHHTAVDSEYGGMAEDDMLEHPAGLMEDDDSMRPKSQEYMSGYMAGRMAAGGMVESGSEDMNMADGGMTDDSDDIDVDEMEKDKHASIAAAIMSKRHKMSQDSGSMDDDDAEMMAEGGEVDLDENSMEQPNGYYKRNEDAALKENYDSDMEDITEPMEGDEHGDEREALSENKLDKVSRIRSRMKARRSL